jgi:hypothetical protein
VVAIADDGARGGGVGTAAADKAVSEGWGEGGSVVLLSLRWGTSLQVPVLLSSPQQPVAQEKWKSMLHTTQR